MDRCYYFELANKMVGASFRPEYVIEAIRSVYSDTVLDNYSEHFVHLFINGVLRVTTLNSLEALSLGWKVNCMTGLFVLKRDLHNTGLIMNAPL